MKYEPKEILLKDKTKCILRSPDPKDAEKMIEYLKMTSDETHFMVRYPEEINITVEQEAEYLEQCLKSNKNFFIAAFIDGKLAGNTGVHCNGMHFKIMHRGILGISIKQKYWNNDIGGILIQEALDKAMQIGYEQMELGVFSDNERAQALYKKFGFEVWGITKNAYKLKDGTYRDEILMGKFLKTVKL